MLQPTSAPHSKNIYLLLLIFPLLALACSLVAPLEIPAQPTQPIAPIAQPAQPIAPIAPAEPALNESPLFNSVLDADNEQLYIDLYKRMNPSVVAITVFTEEAETLLASGEGSGFVYDALGYIITNAHVVHGSKQLDVSFSEGTVLPAEIIGEDLHSDLAVIKVESLPAGVNPLPLGDINTVQVGQTVLAIGNPFGRGGTLTRGIVSALGRTIPAVTTFSIPQSIQTDAAINPGNSGGPLLNLQGQVIGVNAQIQTQNQDRSNSGVGFAIPVSILSRVVPVLIEDGQFVWSWLGVRGRALDPTTAEAMQLPFVRGAYLSVVIDNGPAAKAGLQGATREQTVNDRIVETGGDVITAIDGHAVTSFDDVLIYVAMNGAPGKAVKLTIFRDGEYQEIELTLEARPETSQP